MGLVRDWIQRQRLFARARASLAGGAPEEALRALRDPRVTASPRAVRLRTRSVERLWRQALERSAQGRDSSVARILGLLDGEVGRVGGERWRGRLAALTARAAGPPPEPPGGGAPTPDPSGGGSPPQRTGRAHGAVGDFQLVVDEAGEFAVTTADRLVLGHLRAGRADLPFLADVGAEHARLERVESLRGGAGWRVAPLGDERVTVDGARVPAGGTRLAPDARVELAVNLAFRHEVADPGSSTAVLRLEHGAECAGGSAVVLLGRGPGGRLRVGAHPRCQVRVASLEDEVVLELVGDGLRVASRAGIRRGADAPREAVTLPFPPPARIDLVVGEPSAARPPFGLAVAPSRLPGRS